MLFYGFRYTCDGDHNIDCKIDEFGAMSLKSVTGILSWLCVLKCDILCKNITEEEREIESNKFTAG